VRAILDPNVLVSALLSPTGTPARIVLAWAEGRFELVVSPEVLRELDEVLKRPKFRRWVSQADASEFVEAVAAAAPLVADPADRPQVSSDPRDDYLVALATAAGVDWVVSGDQHVNGHRFLPKYGHRFSPPAAIVSPHWWPCFSPPDRG